MTATDTTDRGVTPALRTTARRVVFWVVIGVVVLLIVGLIAILGRSAAVGEPLGSDNPGPSGSMAVVEVLKQQGVFVSSTDSLQDTVDAVVSAEQTTILLYDPAGWLDRDKLDELTDYADRIVVVAPTFNQLRVLAPGVAHAGEVQGPLEGDCSLSAVERAEEVSGDLIGYRIIEEGSGAIGCLGSGDEVYSVIQADDQVTVLGAIGAITNGEIAQDGNAALILNLLGEHERLIWYLPSVADLDEGGGLQPPPSPPWLVPAILLLGAAAIAIGFWRGRRLGPLVVENLPVTVRASETMLGRARLYERSGARLRALDALRVGTVQRIAKLAGLSRHATIDEIVAASAALTGRPPTDIRRLLVDDVPGTDADLVRRSDELLTLEQDVTRAVRGSSLSRPPGGSQR